MAIRKSSSRFRKSVRTLDNKSSEDLVLAKPSLADKIKGPKIFILLIVLIAILAGAFYFKGLFVAALVNGEPITRLKLIHELESKQGKQALDALVNQTLISQEAKIKNVVVGNEEVDAASKQIEESIKKQGQNLDAALAAQGLSKKEFLEEIKLRKLIEKLLANDIKVTDKEVNEYIEKNKDSFPKDMKEEDLKKAVKQQLEQQKLSTKSQEWIANLQKNAKVNYFVNFKSN